MHTNQLERHNMTNSKQTQSTTKRIDSGKKEQHSTQNTAHYLFYSIKFSVKFK